MFVNISEFKRCINSNCLRRKKTWWLENIVTQQKKTAVSSGLADFLCKAIQVMTNYKRCFSFRQYVNTWFAVFASVAGQTCTCNSVLDCTVDARATVLTWDNISCLTWAKRYWKKNTLYWRSSLWALPLANYNFRQYLVLLLAVCSVCKCFFSESGNQCTTHRCHSVRPCSQQRKCRENRQQRWCKWHSSQPKSGNSHIRWDLKPEWKAINLVAP